jgi:type IV secretion system protein VirD4
MGSSACAVGGLGGSGGTETAGPKISTAAGAREAILPQEVNELPDDEEILFRKGAPAFRLKRVRWYDDANFMNLEQTPVDPPAVTYTLDRDDGSVKFPTEKQGKAA